MGRVLKIGCLGLLGLIGVVVVIGVIAALVGPAPPSSPPERVEKRGGAEQVQPEQQDQQQPELAQVGDTVRVVNAQWTVTDAYITNQLKSPVGAKTGRFVVVEFTFKNLGSEEVTLDETLHVALEDSRGREYGVDVDSWEFVPMRKNIFLQPVNPGVSQDGMVIFPVSPGAGGFVFVGDDVAFLEDQKARFDLGNLQTREPAAASASTTATATATAGQ